MYKYSLLISFFTFFFLNCNQKENSTGANKQISLTSEVSYMDTITTEKQDLSPINSVMDELLKGKKIICKSDSLGSVSTKSSDDYDLITIIKDQEYNILASEIIYHILVPIKTHKLLIVENSGGDYYMYDLYIEKYGRIEDRNRISIDYTWFESGNEENNFNIRRFEIYEDYLIRIIIDQAKDGIKEKLFEYYYIDKDGNFKEIETIEDIHKWQDDLILATKINDENDKIILSTEDLEDLIYKPESEIAELLEIEDYIEDIYINTDYHIIKEIKDKLLMIQRIEGSDHTMYHIGTFDKNLVNNKTTINITPYWFVPGSEESENRKIHFDLYENDLLKIYVREKFENDIKEYQETYILNEENIFKELSQLQK